MPVSLLCPSPDRLDLVSCCSSRLECGTSSLELNLTTAAVRLCCCSGCTDAGTFRIPMTKPSTAGVYPDTGPETKAPSQELLEETHDHQEPDMATTHISCHVTVRRLLLRCCSCAVVSLILSCVTSYALLPLMLCNRLLCECVVASFVCAGATYD